jgi:hypothetical protein
VGEPEDLHGEEEPKSELLLMYNSVCGYVSAIMELWSH